jgi:hypothetical protein
MGSGARVDTAPKHAVWLAAGLGVLLLVPMLPRPVLAAIRVDIVHTVVDDSSGGNGNFALVPGESGAISVRLYNPGAQIVTGVRGTLSSATPGVEPRHGESNSVSDIQPLRSVIAGPFPVSVDPGYPCGETASLSLDVTSDQGSTTIPLLLLIDCPGPKFEVGTIGAIDSQPGWMVRTVKSGQPAMIEIELWNRGDTDATNVTARMSTPAGGADVSTSSADYGTLAAISGVSHNTFELTPTTCDSPLRLTLDLTSDQSSASFPISLPVSCLDGDLEFLGIGLDDQTAGNADGIPQRGETVHVVLWLKNTGSTTLSGIKGSAQVEGADVADASVAFPDAAPGQAIHSSAPVSMTFDANATTAGAYTNCSLSYYSVGGEPAQLAVPDFAEVARLMGRLRLGTDQGPTDLVMVNGLTCIATALKVDKEPSVQVKGVKLVATGTVPLTHLGVGLGLAGAGTLLRRRSNRYRGQRARMVTAEQSRICDARVSSR